MSLFNFILNRRHQNILHLEMHFFFVFVERIWRVVPVKLISDPHLDMYQQQYFDNSVSTFGKKKWNFPWVTLKLQLKWLLKAPLLASQQPLYLASFLLFLCPSLLLSCGMLILELTCQLLAHYRWLWRLFSQEEQATCYTIYNCVSWKNDWPLTPLQL